MIIDSFRKFNVSCVFLLPLLKLNRKKLQAIGFKNSYCFNGEESMVYDNCIHLLFIPIIMEGFEGFLEAEKLRNAPIVDEKDYPGGLVLLTYELPKKFKKDYELVWQGKYSQTSKEYQDMFPKTMKVINKDGIEVTEMSGQHMVFCRYQPLRRKIEQELDVELSDTQEIWILPSIEKETFKLKSYESITTDAQGA